jgi:ankyrin repeat protein
LQARGKDVGEHEMHFYNVVKALLDRGANVNMCNHDKDTPIKRAASQGHLKILKMLLNRGANKDIEEVGVALLCAVHARYADIVEELLKANELSIEYKDDNKFTALCHAARIGHNETVRVLLNNRAKVNSEMGERNPLLLAAAQGHEQVVKLLLDHGAEASFKSIRSTTPLHLAVLSGHQGTVSLLHQDTINTSNGRKRTPLIYAAIRGSVALLRFLLESGADVNSRDDEGRSALSYAAGAGSSALTKILLKREDIEVDSQDNLQRTPLWHAIRWGHMKVVRHLIQFCSRTESLLQLAIECSRYKIADYLIAVQLRREEESSMVKST